MCLAHSNFIDEFAGFRIDERRGSVVAKRFARREMEIGVATCACLADPDIDQIDAALSTGRVVSDAEGRLRLAIPSFANDGARFRLEIEVDGRIAARAETGCVDVTTEALADVMTEVLGATTKARHLLQTLDLLLPSLLTGTT